MFCTKCGTELPENAKFCARCGAPVDGTPNEIPRSSPQKESKCPNCGEALPPFAAVCPSCGHELREVSACASVRSLSDSIDELERRKISALEDDVDSSKAKRIAKACDARIASLIRTYPIPNTREDILEFAILASSNIDPASLKKGWSGRDERKVALAWTAKLRQAYQKAKNMSGSDAAFQSIQELYQESRGPIMLQWFSVLSFPMKAMLFLIFMGVFNTLVSCIRYGFR